MVSVQIFRSAEPYQLPNSTREGILKREGEDRLIYQKALLIVECLYFLGIEKDTWLTFEQIFRLLRDNFGVSYRLVYEGLKAKLIFNYRKSKPVANQRGARPYEYCVPDPAYLNYEFGNNTPAPHDVLERSDLKNLTTYRRALFSAHIRRLWIKNDGKGVKMSRAFQAERVGVSMRTVRTYEKQVDFSDEANYKTKQLTVVDLSQLPNFKRKYDADGKVLPSKKWLRVVDSETERILEVLPYVEYLAAKNLREGKLVFEVEREPNTYYPYLKQDPEDFEGGLWGIDYYYAEMEARNEAGLYRDSNGKWYFQPKDNNLSNPPATTCKIQLVQKKR